LPLDILPHFFIDPCSRRRLTSKDIARWVGVSVTTVSCTLGGYEDVADETRRRILQEAREMGYRPYSMAQSLQRQRTNTLASSSPPLTLASKLLELVETGS
jgi:LacI family transcriptional regulator